MVRRRGHYVHWHKESGERVRNVIIRKRCGCELSVLERIEKNVLQCFGHVERMGEEMLVKRV